MDAFAVSISQGAALKTVKPGYALRTGLIFGMIEGITPLVGWGLGLIASELLASWSHWLAFILLLLLGGRMIWSGWRNSVGTADHRVVKHNIWLLIITAIATSIDALAIGIGLAFLQVNILLAALIIGGVCAIISTTGIIIGRIVSGIIGRWAEVAGGIVLTGIGCQILFSHFYG